MGADGRWVQMADGGKCGMLTSLRRRPVPAGRNSSGGEERRRWRRVKNYTSISCHKTDSAAGPSHSAGAKMQFWLTLAISCNCNTPSSHEVMAGRSASLGSVRTMPALGLQQRCVAAFRVAFLTTPARVPTPGLSAA